jgi:hypothetical protein
MFLPSDNSAWLVAPSDPCQPTPPTFTPPSDLGNPPPSVGTACEDPGYLYDEPVTALVSFEQAGSPPTIQQAPAVPMVSGVDSFTTQPNSRVILRGRNFGSATGTITVDGRTANVLIWTDSRVQFEVPSGTTEGQVTISSTSFTLDGPVLSRGLGTTN